MVKSRKEEDGNCCGPDVTKQVLKVLDDVKLKYHSASEATKEKCSELSSLSSWDITPLILYKNWVDIPCKNGKIGAKSGTPCEFTVQFFDRCYHAAVVNYTLWGVIDELCSLNLPYHFIYNWYHYHGSPHYEQQKSMSEFGSHYAKMRGNADEYIRMVENHKIKLLMPFRPLGHDGYGGKCNNCCGKYDENNPLYPVWRWHWGPLSGAV